MEYRHELKFIVSNIEIEKIRRRLQCVMAQDANHKGEQGYTIRSLYFDDSSLSALCENEAGLDVRSKYRIRLYNGNQDVIHLEKKSKRHDMTKKESWDLTLDDYYAYVESDWFKMLPEMQVKQLVPSCIVEYDRFAFVEPIGNVRITFDTDIRGTNDVTSFWDKSLLTVPALPVGQSVLEVKYDEFLPRWILNAVDLNCLRVQSFSKYAVVKSKVGLMNI